MSSVILTIELLSKSRKRRIRIINFIFIVAFLMFLFFFPLLGFWIDLDKLEKPGMYLLLILTICFFFLVLKNWVSKNRMSVYPENCKLIINSKFGLKDINKVAHLEVIGNFIQLKDENISFELNRKSAFELLKLQKSNIEINYKETSLLDLSFSELMSGLI